MTTILSEADKHCFSQSQDEELLARSRLGDIDYSLFRTLHSGTKAQQRRAVETLFSRHYGLIRLVLRKSTRICRRLLGEDSALEMDDIVQEASLVLLTAIRRFDMYRKTRFSTYAMSCLRHIMWIVRSKSRTIRWPDYIYQKKHRSRPRVLPRVVPIQTRSYSSCAPLLMRMDGRGSLRELGANAELVPGLRISAGIASSALTNRRFAWFVDYSAGSPLHQVESNQLVRMVQRALATLTPKQEEVLRRRFGIDRDEQTLEEVSQDQNFLVTRERIRQIEAKALRKLRHPANVRHLTAWQP